VNLSSPAQDGLVITPAYPSDLQTLGALFARSSIESRRERFHGAVRGIPGQYLHAVVRGGPGVVARVVRDLDRDPSGRWAIALARSLARRLSAPPPVGSVAHFDLTAVRSAG
jgi:hypothetical protein